MDTRLSTKLRAGGSRMLYQLFDYSTSGTDYELSETTLPILTYPQDLEQPEVHTEPNPEPEAQDLVSDPPVRIVFRSCSLTMSPRALRLHN